MNRERVTVTIRESLLRQIDHLIDKKDVRNRSHAIERVLLEKFGDAGVGQAIILGGGKGVIADAGKEPVSPLLIRVDGKLLIERHIDQLRSVGVDELFLSVGSFGDEVRSVIGDGSKYGMKIFYFERDHGTASVLRQAKDLLKETFLMLNGHVVLDSVDFEDMIVFHKKQRSLCTISLAAVNDPSGCGQMLVRGDRVVEFSEKPERQLSNLINAGVYVVDPSVCGMVTPETESFERNVLPELVQKGQLSGYMFDRPWRRVTDGVRK